MSDGRLAGPRPTTVGRPDRRVGNEGVGNVMAQRPNPLIHRSESAGFRRRGKLRADRIQIDIRQARCLNLFAGWLVA